MTTGRSQITVGAILLAAAISLHGYEYVFEGDSASVWLLLWPLTPYVVCTFIFLLSASGVPSIAAAIVALVLDAMTFDAVFIHPTSSTSALAMLFVPLWSAIIFVPVTVVIIRFVVRRLEARRDAL